MKAWKVRFLDPNLEVKQSRRPADWSGTVSACAMRSIFTKFILKPRLHCAKSSSSHLYGIFSMRRKKVSPARKDGRLRLDTSEHFVTACRDTEGGDEGNKGDVASLLCAPNLAEKTRLWFWATCRLIINGLF